MLPAASIAIVRSYTSVCKAMQLRLDRKDQLRLGRILHYKYMNEYFQHCVGGTQLGSMRANSYMYLHK